MSNMTMPKIPMDVLKLEKVKKKLWLWGMIVVN
jgi:hypothetical protein